MFAMIIALVAAGEKSLVQKKEFKDSVEYLNSTLDDT